MPATILSKVIADNTDSIQKVAVLRTSTFAEVNYTGKAAPQLSDSALKVQLAAFNGKLGSSEVALASILLGEDIPALDIHGSVKDLAVGVCVVALDLPAGIENPNKDIVGKPMMVVSTSARKGMGFRMADGTKVYAIVYKNQFRPATEDETVAVVNGLLNLRPTQMVKLFSDKSAFLTDDEA